jgi:hypothetical protein
MSWTDTPWDAEEYSMREEMKLMQSSIASVSNLQKFSLPPGNEERAEDRRRECLLTK